MSGALVLARADLLDATVMVVAQNGSLQAWAAARPGARALAGRGTAWAVEPPAGAGTGAPAGAGMGAPAGGAGAEASHGGPTAALPREAAGGTAAPARPARWVVRHYRRGGAVARWLGDRYLRLGALRPVHELLASAAARSRGVRTPEVLALVVQPAGLFYRADLATAEIPDAMDLAEALWAEHAAAGEAEARLAALGAAGALLHELADAGVTHPDLNAKNILLAPGDDPLRPCAHVLDLDGCSVGEPLSWRRRRLAQTRLERSLRKWERRTGRALTPAEWGALHAALDAPALPVADG